MSYRLASSTDSQNVSEEEEDASGILRPPRRSYSERLTDKGIAAVWVFLAWLVARRTHFYAVLFSTHNHQANRGLLQCVYICWGIQTVLVLYLTVYLPKGLGLTDASAWPVYCPKVIPTATLLGVLSIILLIRATWPVWGFLAPAILGTQAMGLLFGLHFVPWPF